MSKELDYKRLQALIPDWEGWLHWSQAFQDTSGGMPKEAWHWWLAGTLMQACREKGAHFSVNSWLPTPDPITGERPKLHHPKGDWPQAIIEACAEALETADE